MGFSSLRTGVISTVGRILYSFELIYYGRLIDSNLPSSASFFSCYFCLPSHISNQLVHSQGFHKCGHLLIVVHHVEVI